MTISRNDFLGRSELRSLEDEVIQRSLAALELGQFDLSLLALDDQVQFSKESKDSTSADSRTEQAMNIANFVDTLKNHARTQGTKTAIKYYNDGETLSTQLNYLEVDQFSRQVAAHLQTVCKPGDRVLLLCPQGVPFYFSFLGCLYAGAIAVPAYPPKKNRNFERLRAILSDSDASVILCTREVRENIDAETLKILGDQHVTILCVEDIQAKPMPYREVSISMDDVAFLQYTSGSTGTPKGVMVSHRNIASNIKMIMDAWEITPNTVHSSWLPVYHDMGLIGLFLCPLYAGAELGAMPPTAAHP